ncbi:hypothetical protein Pcinc_013465 [Petrolisthes cinctipes]|uniref:Uncharacterized protein n=1 Tax=Petrolisthes cinctipes TaxID=88211 RepID=A0AAE1KSQ1_PETCI|nr:hypothetical protein Pcinc_013465 [Petrolisthes cinctipes]
MSDFGDIPSMPKTGLADPTLSSQDPAPVSTGSNRDSLNLDDFEKVEADQLPPSVSQSARVTTDLMDDIMAQVSHAGQQQQDLLAGLTSGTTKPQVSPDLTSFSTSDPFKRSDDEERFDPYSSGDMMFTGGSSISTTGGAPAEVDLLASAPPPPTGDFRDDSPPLDKPNFDPYSTTNTSVGMTGQQGDSFNDFMSADPQAQQKPTSTTVSESLFDPYSASDDFLGGGTGMSSQFVEEIKQTSAPVTHAARDPSPEPIFKREPSPEPIFKREPTPPFREPTPPLREPTPPLRQPSPAREPTPPLREPTPEFTMPTQRPRQPTPPREPTPPPREPTPPPRQPTPPREPTPPPREPTPPPRQPTPPPRQPTPPREPTPPPREPTPPTPVFVPTPKKAPIQEPHVTPGKTYHVSDATKASFAVFNPQERSGRSYRTREKETEGVPKP